MIRTTTYLLIFLILSPAFFVHDLQSFNSNSKAIYGNTLDNTYNISQINSTASGFEFSKLNSSFNVEGADYYNYSGVLINFTGNFLSFNFSWNDQSSYSMTEIYFLLHYETIEFKVELGVETNSTIYTSNPKKPLAFLPMNHQVHFSFLIGNNSPYFWICKNNSFSYFHVNSVNVTKSNSNFLKLYGKYYFMSISNISTSCKNKFYGTFRTSLNTPTKQLLLTAHKFYSNRTLGPIFDNRSDTFLFVSKNTSLYSFNEFTGNLQKFYKLHNSILTNEYSGNWHIYLYFNSIQNQTLLSVNKTNFYVKKFIFYENSSFFVYNNGKPFIFNKSSYFSITSIGKITEINNKLIPRNYSLKSIFVAKREIYYLFKNNSSLILYELLGNELYRVLLIHNCLLFYTYNYTSHSTLPEIYIENISLYEILFLNQYSKQYLISYGENLSLYSNVNISFLCMGQNISQIDGIVQYVTGGNGIILIKTNGALYTYGNCIPLTNLSINCSKFYTVVKSGDVNTSVVSCINYTEKIMIGNFTQTQNNTSTFMLNLTQLKSLVYNYTIKVINIQGYEQTSTGKIEVDNSVPNIRILTNTTLGVFNNESLHFAIQDPIGVLNEEILIGNSVYFYYSKYVNITVPYSRGIKSLNVTFSIHDDWGINFKRTLKFAYYVQNVTNFSTNLYNGEIVNKNNLSINEFSTSSNVSTFQILILNKETNSSLFYNFTKNLDITLNNGDYLVSLYCIFKTGRNVFLKDYNITVMSNLPTIMVSGLHRRYYSFFTNSQNNSLNLFANSTISGNWVVNLYAPNGLCNVFYNSGKTFRLVINKNNINSNLSGIFILNYTLVTINHYNVSFQKSFFVNETTPFSSTNKILYINSSIFSIYKNFNFLFRNNVRSYILMNNISYSLYENFSFNNSGIFSYDIYSFNDANSFSRLNITFFVSFSPPIISIKGENDPQFSSIVRLQYSSISPIPLAQISIIKPYKINYRINGSIILIDILKDGNYSVILKFVNYCGNSVYMYYNFTEEYYTYIQKVNLNFSLFFNEFNANVNLIGYSTNKVNISWLCNGKIIGVGNKISRVIPNGVDHIQVLIVGSNKTIYSNLTIFSLSSLVLEYGSMISLGLILLIKLPLRFNNEDLYLFILDNQNRKIKYIRKLAMKKRYGRIRFKKALKILIINGKIEIRIDPNGEQWLLRKKE